ncbi:MAG: hypothetical protein JWM27_2795 [Gemmatimonadetes bacterium]|nr:hypothetical protein [Gemmatimonadota bacterium]
MSEGVLPLLVAGGDADANLHSLVRRMGERGCAVRVVQVGARSDPAVTWDLQADELVVDGRTVRAAGAFVRYDVFTHLADPRAATAYRASAWYAALVGWLWAHPEVRLLNRGAERAMNKPFHLTLAARAGLQIPRTLVTNDAARLHDESARARMVAKPVPGGGYCQPLDEVLASAPLRDGRAAAPAIVQNRLEQPEVRIYGVGGRFLPFAVRSDVLDYRASKATRVEALPLDAVPAELVAGLARLMDALGMDYGAADFKTDPATGRLVFLEINSSPMFAAFDAVSGGAVSDAIIDFLLGGAADGPPAIESPESAELSGSTAPAAPVER